MPAPAQMPTPHSRPATAAAPEGAGEAVGAGAGEGEDCEEFDPDSCEVPARAMSTVGCEGGAGAEE